MGANDRVCIVCLIHPFPYEVLAFTANGIRVFLLCICRNVKKMFWVKPKRGNSNKAWASLRVIFTE